MKVKDMIERLKKFPLDYDINILHTMHMPDQNRDIIMVIELWSDMAYGYDEYIPTDVYGKEGFHEIMIVANRPQ